MEMSLNFRVLIVALALGSFVSVFLVSLGLIVSRFLAKRRKAKQHEQKLREVKALPDCVLISAYCDKNLRWNMHIDAGDLLEVLTQRNLLVQARTSKILKTLKY